MKKRKKSVKSSRKNSPARGRKSRRKSRPIHPFEVRLKAVKLYLEGGHPAEAVARELGLGKGTIFTWVRGYRERGEEGLKPKAHPAISSHLDGQLGGNAGPALDQLDGAVGS